MSGNRVLLVDDNESFRRFLVSKLRQRDNFQIIGEVSDGQEAVHKAEELQPDLILLDIGLPTLNGMEAARRIGRLVPHAKILFFSQESSPDVVREARRVGAIGYVHKERAHSDLLPALEAFLASKQFVSSGLKGWDATESGPGEIPRHHEVQFYSEDEVLIESFAGFISAALKISDVTIVLATKPHLEDLFQRLKAESVDVVGAIQRGTYISIDAVESLSAIMVDGLPDALLFFESIDGLIEGACKKAKVERPRVAFCGERVGLLWAEGNTEAAIRLEQLCNDLATKYEVDILCAYPLGTFSDDPNEADFKKICAEHSAVHSR